MAGTGLRLIVATLCLYLAQGADLTFDAMTGEIVPNVTKGDGFEVAQVYRKDIEFGDFCTGSIVFKLTFDELKRRRAEIKLFHHPDEKTILNYSFDLADSKTSLGGSDTHNQSNNAEVFANNKALKIVGRNKPANDESYGKLYERSNFMKGNLTINVSNMMIEIRNGPVGDPGTSIVHYNSQELFALNGQPDSDGSINYDLYLAINRVVHPEIGAGGRTGFGLCSMELNWHNKA